MKRLRETRTKRVTVTVPAFDLLSRRIARAAAAKRGIERAMANRLLADELRKTRKLSEEQARLLADFVAGELPRDVGGRPREDDLHRTVCDVFGAYRTAYPKESETATRRRLAGMRWPVWGDDPAADDDEARAVAISGPATPTSYRVWTDARLKGIIKAGRKMGTKPRA